jgi:hypothetical protein
MPALRRWHGRLHFPCGEMSSLATPVTADLQTARNCANFLYACGHDRLESHLRVIRCNTYPSIIVSTHHPENAQLITSESKRFCSDAQIMQSLEINYS